MGRPVYIHKAVRVWNQEYQLVCDSEFSRDLQELLLHTLGLLWNK